MMKSPFLRQLVKSSVICPPASTGQFAWPIE